MSMPGAFKDDEKTLPGGWTYYIPAPDSRSSRGVLGDNSHVHPPPPPTIRQLPSVSLQSLSDTLRPAPANEIRISILRPDCASILQFAVPVNGPTTAAALPAQQSSTPPVIIDRTGLTPLYYIRPNASSTVTKVEHSRIPEQPPRRSEYPRKNSAESSPHPHETNQPTFSKDRPGAASRTPAEPHRPDVIPNSSRPSKRPREVNQRSADPTGLPGNSEERPRQPEDPRKHSTDTSSRPREGKKPTTLSTDPSSAPSQRFPRPPEVPRKHSPEPSSTPPCEVNGPRSPSPSPWRYAPHHTYGGFHASPHVPSQYHNARAHAAVPQPETGGYRERSAREEPSPNHYGVHPAWHERWRHHHGEPPTWREEMTRYHFGDRPPWTEEMTHYHYGKPNYYGERPIWTEETAREFSDPPNRYGENISGEGATRYDHSKKRLAYEDTTRGKLLTPNSYGESLSWEETTRHDHSRRPARGDTKRGTSIIPNRYRESLPRKGTVYGNPATSPFMRNYSARESAMNPMQRSAALRLQSPTFNARVKKPKQKKRKDAPKRPLSAYNFFFRESRQRYLKTLANEQQKDKGLFQKMADYVSKQWRNADLTERKKYEEMAKKDSKKYYEAMKAYRQMRRLENELAGEPLSAYELFRRDQSKDGENDEAGEQAKKGEHHEAKEDNEMSEKWKKSDPETIKTYEDLAKEEEKKYETLRQEHKLSKEKAVRISASRTTEMDPDVIGNEEEV